MGLNRETKGSGGSKWRFGLKFHTNDHMKISMRDRSSRVSTNRVNSLDDARKKVKYDENNGVINTKLEQYTIGLHDK